MFGGICEEKDIVIEDVTKCTEHPLTLILELFECAVKNKSKYSVKVPHGSVPFNLLMEYAKKYGVKIDVESEGEFVKYIIESEGQSA